MKIIIASLVVIIGLIMSSHLATADELRDRRELKTEVLDAFNSNNHKALESLAHYFRSEESRTSSGVWKLTFYYFALSDYGYSSARYPDTAWKNTQKKSEEWIKTFPGSPTPYIAHSVLFDNLAYSYIIKKKNKKTTSEDIRLHKAQLESNRLFLIKNKTVASKDPHWYVSMIRVATAQRWSEKKYMQLIKEAVERYPMYLQIYFAGVDYYSPKFGGNIKLMDKFARYAVSHTKDKLGMALYARIYWAAIQSRFREDVWSVIAWEDFKQGVDDVLTRYPDDWNLNYFALFACLAGDSAKAGDLIKKIRTKPIRQVWRTKENFEKCRSAVTPI